MEKLNLNSIPNLLSRIVIGTVFIQSGWGKLHDLDKVISYFESLGIPFANIQAPFVATTELVAGGFILVGLLTRLSSLPLIGIMTVAIMTAKWEDVSGLSSMYDMSEFLYIMILLWILANGAGYFSADNVLKRFFKHRLVR